MRVIQGKVEEQPHYHDARNQYYRDLNRVAPFPLSQEQQGQLLAQARAGDASARERLIYSLLRPIAAFAYRTHRYSNLWHYEMMDLVSVGNLVLIEHFDDALSKDDPLLYLISYAYSEMRDFCRKSASLIVTPRTIGEEPVIVESLEALCDRRKDDDDDGVDFEIFLGAPLFTVSPSHINCIPLYEALSKLTEASQQFIAHLFGLFDVEPMTLAEWAGGVTDSKPYNAAKARKSQVIKRLHTLLAEHYPQYTQAVERVEHRPYMKIAVPPFYQKKLATAVKKLEHEGRQVTGKALQRETHVNTSYISAYLYQQKLAGSA